MRDKLKILGIPLRWAESLLLCRNIQVLQVKLHSIARLVARLVP